MAVLAPGPGLVLVCYIPLARMQEVPKQAHRANERLSTAQRISIRPETTSRSAGEHQRDA